MKTKHLLVAVGIGFLAYKLAKREGSIGGLGTDPVLVPQVNVEPTQEQYANMLDSIKAEMLQSASVQAGVVIAANFIPVVGTAVSALLGVLTAYAANYQQKKIKVIVADFQYQMEALSNTYKTKYKALQDQIVAEEAVAVRAVLSPGTAGLGASVSTIISSTFGKGTEFGRAQAAVSHAVAQATVIPVQLTIAASLKAGKTVAKLVGADGAVKDIDRLESQNREKAQAGMTKMEAATASPQQAVSDAGQLLRRVTGEESVFEARRKCNAIYDQAAAKLAADYLVVAANMSSPEFRKALREYMIAHPEKFQQLNDISSKLSAVSNMKIMMGAGLAAVAGLFMFRK